MAAIFRRPSFDMPCNQACHVQSQFVKMAENVDSDAEFLASMNVFGLPIPEEYTHTPEEKGREAVLYTKTGNGKAIGQPISFNHNLSKDLREAKRCIRQVLADTVENVYTADEIVVENIYYVKKQSKSNSVFLIVNNSGMNQVFTEYPEKMKNGHKGAPLRLAVDWHFRGEFLGVFIRLRIS